MLNPNMPHVSKSPQGEGGAARLWEAVFPCSSRRTWRRSWGTSGCTTAKGLTRAPGSWSQSTGTTSLLRKRRCKTPDFSLFLPACHMVKNKRDSAFILWLPVYNVMQLICMWWFWVEVSATHRTSTSINMLFTLSHFNHCFETNTWRIS